LAFCPPDAKEDEQMMFASRDNDIVALERLLACPRDPETKDECGKTPLHHAAEHVHVEPMRCWKQVQMQETQTRPVAMSKLHAFF